MAATATDQVRRPSRRRPSLAAARVSPSEYDTIRAAAEERGMSVSRFIRDTMLRESQPA